MNQIVLVDGYNMIGAWPELRQLADSSLEDARDRLIELLANYQGFSGRRIILIFDAHQVAGIGGKYKQSRLEIRYTKEKETADECIERLAGELGGRKIIIHVATSDMAEQHVAFGRGALRMSARELLLAVQESERTIRKQLSDPDPHRAKLDSTLNYETKSIMEKWRRDEW